MNRSNMTRSTPWATIREAERYARVGDGVIRAAVKRGDIPGYRRSGGHQTIVNLDDIDCWIRKSWDPVMVRPTSEQLR